MSNGKKEILPGEHYPFRLINSKVITCVFQTDTGMPYEITFKYSPCIFFSELPFSESTYEFLLLPMHADSGHTKTGSDDLTAPAVIAIFVHFYEQFDEDNVTIYICDSSDFRQHVRKQKFDHWFVEYNNRCIHKNG